MVTKKVRSEYMKKFRDPRWDTFTKCYEDSLRYRLTRRVMEHSHKPWFWEGWDSGSESSGWSTPRLSRNKVVPLSLPPPTATPAKHSSPSPGDAAPPGGLESEAGGGEASAGDPAPTAVAVNGAPEEVGGEEEVVAAPGVLPPVESDTDNGPADTPPSSDGEPGDPPQPPPARRHRRRQGPGSEPARPGGSPPPPPPPVTRKPPRAKSTPAISTKDSGRVSSRGEGPQGAELRRTANHSSTSDACVQTRRLKRSSDPERRRSRSADLEKLRGSRLTVASDHWVTEYMRCFSARLR